MTPEQMRIAAAESLGWKIIPAGKDSFGVPFDTLGNKGHETILADKLPRYDKCLNAVAVLEKTLSEKERIEYLMRLSQPTKSAMPFDPNYAEEQWLLVTKSPIARLEAYLRAKGIWKEENDKDL